MEKKETLFLLDAYALIYRAYYAFIKTPRINSKGMNTSAVMGFVNTLEEVLKKEQPSHIGIAFDPSGPTFRHKAFAEYKAQRQETPEDIRRSIPFIKQIIKAYNIPILEVENFEADDVIGTLSVMAAKKGITTYMITPDKDYGQLVTDKVFMYRPKHTGGFETMGPAEVQEKYQISTPRQIIDLLGLMGDASDNIPGCPGVGEKTAAKLIGEFGSIDQLLQNTDKLKGALKTKIEENREKILFSRFLATIRTDAPIRIDIDALKSKEPNLPAIESVFGELEFQSLHKRVLLRLGRSVTPAKGSPDLFSPTLFDSPSDSEAGLTAATHLTNRNNSDNSAPIQGDLFAINPPDGQEPPENSILRSYNKAVERYELVDTVDKRERLIRKILNAETLAIDTETTGVEPMTAQLVGMSFCCEESQAFYVPIPTQQREEAVKWLQAFKPVFENEQITKVGQNIKYDIIVLHNHGIHVRGPLFDTMLAHYVLQPELRHNMDYLAEIYLRYKTIHIEELIGQKGKNQKSMRDLSPDEVYEYACEDADITFRLKKVLESELRKNHLEHLFYDIEMPLVPVLAHIETSGVRLDTQALKQTSALYTKRMNEIEHDIHQLAGTVFNINSPKQVGEVLFDRLHLALKPKKTKTGQYITSEEVLESLRSKHPIAGKILEQRSLKKLLGTYIDALPLLINPVTGKVHTSLNQSVTATGRLSSSNPNLQNIPVRDNDGKEIRKAFIPDEGCEFLSADYSQIELRIMAHLSGDQNMIDAFNQGHDVHAATAAKIYKVGIDEVTKEMRRKAKTANFGIIYGISVFGLAERMEVSRQEAKQLIEDYFATYPQIKEHMDRSIAFARENGYVETIFHRKRYLPDIHSRNATVRGYAERNAINAPIQGSAADIIKVAMARIHQRFTDNNLKAKMILQVHDELNFSVPAAEKSLVEKIVIEEMEHAYSMKVPLKADFGWGKNWLEAH